MRDGLWRKLNDLIKEKGYLSREEMEQVCRETGYLISNGERRLRFSESPNVYPDIPKKAIVGWFYRPVEKIKPLQEKANEIAKQGQFLDTCKRY